MLLKTFNPEVTRQLLTHNLLNLNVNTLPMLIGTFRKKLDCQTL